MKKRKGFTLAEVLITLGIIGVIAAMTIPTLIQNTNSTKFATQFKKTLSTLSQAALMGQAQYDTDFSMVRDKCGSSGATESLNNGDLSFCALFNTTLAGKTYYDTPEGTTADNVTTGALVDKKGKAYAWNKSTTGTGTDAKSNSIYTLGTLNKYHIYTLADGSLFGFDKDGTSCSVEPGTVLNNTTLKATGTANDGSGSLEHCIGFIDVNGTNPPNVEVSCKTSSENKLDASSTCSVNQSGSGLGDIFPIVFHDGTVEPASPAARTILLQGK